MDRAQPEAERREMDDAERTLERLEELSRQIETAANAIAVKASGGESGARNRIAQVKMRLRVALDQLDAYPYAAGDVTDE